MLRFPKYMSVPHICWKWIVLWNIPFQIPSAPAFCIVPFVYLNEFSLQMLWLSLKRYLMFMFSMKCPNLIALSRKSWSINKAASCFIDIIPGGKNLFGAMLNIIFDTWIFEEAQLHLPQNEALVVKLQILMLQFNVTEIRTFPKCISVQHSFL